MTNEEAERLRELLKVAEDRRISWFVSFGPDELRRGVATEFLKDRLNWKKAFDDDVALPHR
jgi:hypothetical protein